MKKNTGAVRVFISSLILAAAVPAMSSAATSQTSLTQTVASGSLSLSSNPTASLSTQTASNAPQVSTGSLGNVNVSDSRGLGLGWSATATASNFSAVNSPVKVSGNNNTLSSAGTYTGSSAGTYTVTITTGGAAGTAQYSVSGLESASAQTTGSNVAVGTKGVTATFAAATYAVGDSWTIRVDIIPVTGLTITPSLVTTNSGLSAGVVPGTLHLFSSTNDPTTIMSALVNDGMGSYTNTPTLALVIPANTYANTYTATVTETVN